MEYLTSNDAPSTDTGTDETPVPGLRSPRVEVTESMFLFEKGETVNLRLLTASGKMVSVSFANRKLALDFALDSDEDESVTATYVQLQVIAPKASSELTLNRGVRREHISRYRWFVVDIDTLRPDKSHSNSTDDEKLLSFEVAESVVNELASKNWPEPVWCDSGNGWHLVWKIDLENTPVNHELLRSCLAALAAKFNNEHGEIDTSLAEPEQLIKLWGTMVRKGEDTEERPWRRSHVIVRPEQSDVVPLDLLKALAAEAPVKQAALPRKSGKPESNLHSQFDPEQLFGWCRENLPDEYKGFFDRDPDADHSEDGVRHYVMDGCFWAERKHSGDRKKTEFILGRNFGFSCFSDECDGVTIGDILSKVTRLAGKPYPHAIWQGRVLEADTFARIMDAPWDDAEPTPTVPPAVELAVAKGSVDALAFPEDALYGKLGEMARALQMPLGLAYPAVLAAYSVLPVSDTLGGTRINMYTILLAPPGGGKNVAIKRALEIVDVPKEHFRQAAPVSDRGILSLIGHKQKKVRGEPDMVIKGPRKMLLVTNEAANVLKKANIANSSLGSTLCEIWDENEYAAVDRGGEQGCDCRVSWLGGLPIKREHPEEFSEYFGRETGRGLLSRTILGFSDVKFNYREWQPPTSPMPLEDAHWEDVGFQTPKNVVVPGDVLPLLDGLTDEEGRLKYNALKVALLTSAANGGSQVSVECMQAAKAFADWQGRLREVFHIGLAAEFNLEAQFTEAFLGALKQKGGDKEYVNWKKLSHDRKWVQRFGPRVVNATVDSLIKAEAIDAFEHIEVDERDNEKVVKDTRRVRIRDWKKHRG